MRHRSRRHHCQRLALLLTRHLTADLRRRMLAEALGTALLVVAVIGSGIAAERLAPGQGGLQLLINAAATAGALVAILLALGPVSGAHLNPVVTLAGGRRGVDAAGYVVAQFGGGVAGAVVANVMYGLPPVELSATTRSSAGLWLAELVATFGLVLVVGALASSGRAASAPYAVAAYIGGAYFFTASTSFANPAVTVARTLTDTFAGIAPSSAPAFLVAQAAGAVLAALTVRALCPEDADPLALDPTGADRARGA
jgi:glycerol uptake facilitator-like aquaporin